tara:strand:+ start:446 stop:562 length:117 start_codon:yes stop_codon:yes gene_type:complete
MKIALFGYGKMGKIVEKIAKIEDMKSFSRLIRTVLIMI